MATNSSPPLWSFRNKTVLTGLLAIQFAVAYLVGREHLLTNDQFSVF